jgi:Ca2+/Na+ antiporter
MLLYLCGDYFMDLKNIFMWIWIVIVIIFLYIMVKRDEKYIEDNSYDSKKYISPHTMFSKFNFATLMISIGSAIYIAIALSLASSQDRRSYKRGIECCNQNNGTIDGYYCNFNYRNEVSIRDLDNETSVEYRAYCLKDEESLKELRPYDWKKYVDE